MNCACNKITTVGGATGIIRHPYGNVLRLAVPLTLCVVDIVDGEATETYTDFTPNMEYPLVVTIGSAAKTYTYDAELHDSNVAYIEDKGNIAIGTYAITITCKDNNGDPMRFKAKVVLKVVDCTDEAYAGGIGWYEGLDGQSIYPVLTKNSEQEQSNDNG